jgi:hypothetical protein
MRHKNRKYVRVVVVLLALGVGVGRLSAALGLALPKKGEKPAMKTKIAVIGTVALIVMLVTTGTSAQDQNLIVNGDFEVPVASFDWLWDVYPSGTPGLGWQVEWADNYPGAPSPANLELQQEPVPGYLPYSGSQHAELDSDWNHPWESVPLLQGSVRIYQDIPTCPGGTFELQYAWSPRPDHPDNVMEVWWGTEMIATHSMAGGTSTQWTLETRSLTAPGDTTRLMFVEMGEPDCKGMFLDAVRVEEIACKADVDIQIKLNPCCPPISGEAGADCVIDCKPYIWVAVLGSASFDVAQVDPATLNLGSLTVLRDANDAPLCSIEDATGPSSVPDGYQDLVCQFENTIQLTGQLNDGTPLEGSSDLCCQTK